MKCIAIDDEPMALKILRRYCEQTPSLNLLGTYTDPLEGLSCIRTMNPDLLFLDVKMPDISGIDLAGMLNGDLMIIFTTAHRSYAVEGFELNVVDYLLKPFSLERFLAACEKAEERRESLSLRKTPIRQLNAGQSITFRCNYMNVQLDLNDILYIEALDNYIKIVTEAKTYVPAMTMKKMQEMLPQSGFIRVHKSFIVPAPMIKYYNHEVVITDRMEIPIGRKYYKDFIERMKQLRDAQ